MTQIIQQLCNYSEKLLIFEHRAFTHHRPEASRSDLYLQYLNESDLGLLLITEAVALCEVSISVQRVSKAFWSWVGFKRYYQIIINSKNELKVGLETSHPLNPPSFGFV